jgi:hypothetical protein
MSFIPQPIIRFAPPQPSSAATAEAQRRQVGSDWQTFLSQAPELARFGLVASSPSTENKSIIGMVSVPVATDFTESKQSLNELTTQRGDLSTVPDIDLCGFMSNLPDSNIDLSEPSTQITSSLNEVMASIQGITLPILQVASDSIYGIVGTVDSAVGDLGAALQSSIPTLSCGKKPVTVEDVEQVAALGQAFFAEPQVAEPVVETPAYGTQPVIVIDSPEVTVDALDDQIDLGEF